MSDREEILTLEPIEPKRYNHIGLDYLIMYTIGQLRDIGADLSYENIVVASFKLFPSKFSLPGYSEFPASKRVHDAIFHCTYKSKRWLSGKTATGFSITERSELIIKQAYAIIEGKPEAITSGTSSKTRRKEKILLQIRSTYAYQKASEGRETDITESELCYLLQGTLDTPKNILNQNLTTLITYATELQELEVSRLLKQLEEHFKDFLFEGKKRRR